MTATETYIQEKVNELIAQGERSNNISFTKSTCDTNSYGWDLTYHNMMPRIAEVLRKKGYQVTSSVKWGVTDWVFIKP